MMKTKKDTYFKGMTKVPKLKEGKENSPWHFAFDWVLIQYLLFPTLFGRECRL